MLTGQSSIGSAVQSLKSGAFDYLTKPCDLHTLISLSNRAVTRKKQREAEILDARMKPFITEQQRAELIAQILAAKE